MHSTTATSCAEFAPGTDGKGAPNAETAPWMQAVGMGFHEADPDAEGAARMASHFIADEETFLGVYVREAVPGVRRRDLAGRHLHLVPQGAELGRRVLRRHPGDLRGHRPSDRTPPRHPAPDDDARARAGRRRGLRRGVADRVRGHHLPPLRLRQRHPRARDPRPPRTRSPCWRRPPARCRS
ncbi:hypothetical protein Q9Q99_08090 [Curtobacterium flaccumfaciens]|nr:hypothetical protein Q9Q99_08090 [Curtobacterium flaccumfaciens]